LQYANSTEVFGSALYTFTKNTFRFLYKTEKLKKSIDKGERICYYIKQALQTGTDEKAEKEKENVAKELEERSSEAGSLKIEQCNQKRPLKNSKEN